MTTHTIPLNTAEALWELRDHDGDTHDGYEVVDNEAVDTTRWTSVHRLIIRRTADDTLWALPYEEPLTEMQDCDRFNGDPVTVRKVYERLVTVPRYVNA